MLHILVMQLNGIYIFMIFKHILNLYLIENVSASELPTTSFIKGKSSGASGFAVAAGAGNDA